jgi:ATP phosphoribosyltransferase
MENETLLLLQSCGLTINKVNPRQYIARISEIPTLEVWFQRSADVVRKVRDGDTDLGIVGYDKIAEYCGSENNVVIIHDALGYGHCRLAVALPEEWTDINSVGDLARLAQEHDGDRPLRVVSKYQRLAETFLNTHQIKPHRILHADGALEAAPQMGTADFIVDLVSSGVTLRENRLKEIEGGELHRSQAMFIGNRPALTHRPHVLAICQDLLERFEAHLRALEHQTVIANIRGDSPDDVAAKIFGQSELGGLQGPTISRVYIRDATETTWFAISLVVHKDRLHRSIEQLREIGGSGVLVLPVTYIFEEEPQRWQTLLKNLNLAKETDGDPNLSSL